MTAPAPRRTTAGEMPFLEHLEELRWRLVWSLGALGAGFLVAFAVVSKVDIIRMLERPVLPYLHGHKLVYTHPGDPFTIVLNAALVLGVLIASPIIAYQVWAFISPALHRHEKRVVVPVMVGAAALFAAGVSLAFFAVLPFTLGFLLNFQTASLDPMLTASEYFGFAINLALAFGVVFELPILILALTALGLVTPATLKKFRRHALVLCVIGAAFVTPGADPTSLFALSVPLYLLYEVSILLSIVVFRRRERRAAAAARAEALAPGYAAPAVFSPEASPDGPASVGAPRSLVTAGTTAASAGPVRLDQDET
ncbi:Sec-independent protein translocase protein TatC [Gemmatimonadetes bacterium T265]|nr:Sec-independent protein translocase protein TatC [Gemmatimonadetes bacterium T265]